MSVSELLRWQWQGYPRYHQSRSNLLLHIVVVPLFLLGNLALLRAAIQGSWLMAALAMAAMVVSVAAQGRGHAKEPGPARAIHDKSMRVTHLLRAMGDVSTFLFLVLVKCITSHNSA